MKTCPNLECPDRVERGVIGEFSDSAEVCPTCGARLVAAPEDEDVESDAPDDETEDEAPDVEPSELDFEDDENGESEEDSDEESDEGVELVCVLRSADEAQLAMVKSLLECEGIEYIVRGEILQDWFGLGRMTGTANYITGPAEVCVRTQDAEKAAELIGAEPVASDPEEPEEPEDDTGRT